MQGPVRPLGARGPRDSRAPCGGQGRATLHSGAGELEPYVTRGSDRGVRRVGFPRASRKAGGFFVFKDGIWTATTLKQSSVSGRRPGTRPAPSSRRIRTTPPTRPAGRRTCSRCSRTRRASCTWGMSSTTRSATSCPISRRRNGYSVLRPMGYDAFGLPAENAAIREGGHPREVTERNIAAIREQIRRMGWSIDWTREVSTHEPEYYRWTQWLFLKLFEQGLAYRKAAPVKWCPNDQTVLANEQVIDGHCERCGWEVESRNLEQWMFKITDFSDRLLDDMAELDWPERVLTMQRNWIGRSEGAEVTFRVEELSRGRAGLHDPAGHALRRDVLRARAGASARREVRRSLARRRGAPDLCAARRGEEERGACRRARRRPVSSPASTRSIR